MIKEPRVFKARSFVAECCRGSPAGVCLLPKPRDDAFYRDTAIKIGAPETAFVCEGSGTYQLRWFTCGGAEVDLCGHATLAAAGILWQKRYINQRESIRFMTRSGVLMAKEDGENISLDFPRETITPVKSREYDFSEILGFSPLFIGKTSFDYLVIAKSENIIRDFQPDFTELKTVKTRGIIISARSSRPEYDFVSRFFAPLVGINEDPVTGSAHCALAVYWGGILKRDKMVGCQTSREGGVVSVELLKDRVLLGGRIKEVRISAAFRKSILSI